MWKENKEGKKENAALYVEARDETDKELGSKRTERRQNGYRKTTRENLSAHSLAIPFIVCLIKTSTPSFPSSFRTDSWRDKWLSLSHIMVIP